MTTPRSAPQLAPAGLRRLRDRAREKVDVLIGRALDRNRLAGLGWLRRHRPLLQVGPLLVVTRHDDVLEVLRAPDTFTLPYASHLPGSFVLGLSGAQHARHTAELRTAFRADDADLLCRMVAGDAGQRVAYGRGEGSLDVGSDLVHPVLSNVVGRYLGAPGPDPGTQLQWADDIFRNIFLNPGNLQPIIERAERAATAMGAHLDQLIAARSTADDGPDDVLGRLLDRQRTSPETALSHREIRDNLLGLGIGWLWHGTKAAVIAVDELLDRPEQLAAAQAAAAVGDLERLRRLLWEVYRFRPVQAGLPRTCTRTTTLAGATPRARQVRAGTSVFVGTHAAMGDETAIPDPLLFDPTRADGQYLVFGDGLHRCFGEQMMRIQLPALLAPLLRVEGLRRADARAGRLRYDGPRADGFRVCVPA